MPPTTMPLQRRYSITGQTPSPDNVPVVKSPKLQTLDTSVQNTSCGLCEGGATTIARTSSKRSATQLPSPNTPSSHELPTKIARLGLEQGDVEIEAQMEVDGSEDDDIEPEHEHEYVFAYPSDYEEDGALSTGVTTPEDHALSSSPTFGDEDGFAARLLEQDRKGLLGLTSGEEDRYEEAETEAEAPHVEFAPESLQIELEPELFALEIDHEPHELTTPPSPLTRTTPAITFETLPPEIRSQIYLELGDLVLSYPLIYCLSTFANRKQHPLASVSRLIRSESLAIFYSYNTWIIKLEFRLMYESFQDWIRQLGEHACDLRLVTIAVRGRLFKPKTVHSNVGGGAGAGAGMNMGMGMGMGMNMGIGMGMNMIGGAMAGVPHQLVSRVEGYSPPDGDASFGIDLSEKYNGGKVTVERNDGTPEAGEVARLMLEGLVRGLWEKRRAGTLNGRDWVEMVDRFLKGVGWW